MTDHEQKPRHLHGMDEMFLGHAGRYDAFRNGSGMVLVGDTRVVYLNDKDGEPSVLALPTKSPPTPHEMCLAYALWETRHG